MNMLRPVRLFAFCAWEPGNTPGEGAGDAPDLLAGSTGGVVLNVGADEGSSGGRIYGWRSAEISVACVLSTFDLITGSPTVVPGARRGATCLPQLPQKTVSLSKGVLQFGHTIVRFPLGPPCCLRALQRATLLRWQDMEYACQ